MADATARGRGTMGRYSLFIALALGLMACDEDDTVLPGTREPIDAALSTFEADSAASLRPENQTVTIVLPAAERNSAAAQFYGSPAFRTPHPALGSSLTRVWTAGIGAGDGRRQRITADPVVGGGRVFAMDAGTRVSAFTTEGALIWSVDVNPGLDDSDEASGGGMTLEGDTLYVSSGFGAMRALDVNTGRTLWEQKTQSAGTGRPLVLDDLVYLTAGDQVGWALEKDTGRIAWQTSAAETIVNVLGSPSPVSHEGLVIFAFGTGELKAVFRQGGLPRWDASVLGRRSGRSLSTVEDVTGAPVVAGGVLYAGAQSGRTVAIDAASGARIWTAQEGAISPVLPVGGSVFLISDRNELLRLDAADGARVWGQPLPNFTAKRPRRSAEVFAHYGPVLAGGRLIVASGDGLLRSYDPEDGSLVSTVDLPEGATTRPIVADNTLFVVDRKGQLHAFR